MLIFQNAEPQHYDVTTVSKLPKGRPFGIFDLDGTLTRPESELILASFVKSQALDVCEGPTRERLRRSFMDWKEGKKVYEPYLEEVGQLYAEMLAAANLTRSQVMELGERWFQEEGYKEVLPYAQPMMRELENFRMNRILMTGAPMEIAHHFASHIGTEHVFSMRASTNADGVYTGRMHFEHNTGLLGNKGAICRKISREFATAFGAGNTQSDTCIMETAYFQAAENPIDLKGRAYLMNVGQVGDPIVERFMKASGHHYNRFRYFCIPIGAELEPLMDFFRGTLRQVLIDNRRLELLHEIEGVRPLTAQEKADLKKRRANEPEWW